MAIGEASILITNVDLNLMCPLSRFKTNKPKSQT